MNIYAGDTVEYKKMKDEGFFTPEYCTPYMINFMINRIILRWDSNLYSNLQLQDGKTIDDVIEFIESGKSSDDVDDMMNIFKNNVCIDNVEKTGTDSTSCGNIKCQYHYAVDHTQAIYLYYAEITIDKTTETLPESEYSGKNDIILYKKDGKHEDTDNNSIYLWNKPIPDPDAIYYDTTFFYTKNKDDNYELYYGPVYDKDKNNIFKDQSINDGYSVYYDINYYAYKIERVSAEPGK
jgi:hypothetical protein